MEIFKLLGTIAVNKEGALKDLKAVESQAEKTSTGMRNSFQKFGDSMKKHGEQIGTLGRKMTLFGTIASTAIVGTFKSYTDYETKLVDMAKVTDESFDSIEEKIQGLDPILGNYTDLMSGYYQVISAGVTDPIEALELLETAARTAQAAHVEQSEVVKGITKVMEGYGDEIDSSREAADLFFAIEKEGQTSTAELIPLIGGLANVSHQMGIDAEEMGGALALITRTAGSTAEAATQYEAVLTGLIKPTTDMQTLTHDLGYESTQQMIAEEGLVGALKLVQDATGGNIEKLGDLFGRKEAIVGFTALSKDNFGSLSEIIENVSDKTGKADEAFKEWSESGEAKMQEMKNSMSDLTIVLGEAFAPSITLVVEKISEIIQSVIDWSKANPDLMETIGNLGAKIAGIAAVGGPILIAISAFSKLAGLLTMPAGLFAAAITGIILIWKNWDSIVTFVEEWAGKIETFLLELKDYIVEKITEAVDWVTQKFEDLANLPGKMLDWGKNAIGGFVSGIFGGKKDIENAVEEGVTEPLAGHLQFRSPPKRGLLKDSDKWMPKMIQMLAQGIRAGGATMSGASQVVTALVKGDFDKMSTDTKETITQMMEEVVLKYKEGLEELKEETETFGSVFTGLWGSIQTNFVDNFAKPFLGKLEDELTPAIENFFFGVEGYEADWGSFWQSVWQSFKTWISNLIAKLLIAIPLIAIFSLFTGGFSWSTVTMALNLVGISWNKGGGVGYARGGEAEYHALGGPQGTDTVPAWLTPGEYIISKPMTDFIKRTGVITSDLTRAIQTGAETPTPTLGSTSGGGVVGIGSGVAIDKLNVAIYAQRLDESTIAAAGPKIFSEFKKQLSMRGLALVEV